MNQDKDFKIRNPVVCNSGLILSVQASKKHFCKPKTDDGPYTNVEVCTYDVLIEDWPDPLCTYNQITGIPENVTYYNVSSEALVGLVYTHGGVKNGNLPKLIL